MQKFSVLVVDDEKIQRESLAGFFKKNGYDVYLAGDADRALQKVQSYTIDIVLTDYKMSGQSGLELLRRIKELNPEIPVIMMTAYGKIEDAVTAMKDGASDYLSKPIDLDELEILIKRALRLRQLTRENKDLRERLQEKHRFDNIITGSALMEETLNLAARSAASKASVLIEGESGTGKELIARAIHQASPRKDKIMVVVNCAAINDNLLESELFGHEKGAFTGAVRQKNGRVEEADGGTLFLDEVGDIPLTTQVKLLRFLQFGEFQRVGGNQTLNVDVRLITATNRDLQEMIVKQQFREDFYYRLNVINVHVPPLRSRKEDIPLLIDHFITRYARQNMKQIGSISREALDVLMKYSYPGNVRELENLIERAVVLSRDTVITVDELPIHLRVASDDHTYPAAPLDYYQGTLKERIESFEKDLIERALNDSADNQSRAAESLGTNERNLRYKMEKYHLKS